MFKTVDELTAFIKRYRNLQLNTAFSQKSVDELDYFIKTFSNPIYGEQGVASVKKMIAARKQYVTEIEAETANHNTALALVELLAEPAHTIVKMRLIDGKDWLAVTDKVAYSRTQASRIFKAGLAEILARQQEAFPQQHG